MHDLITLIVDSIFWMGYLGIFLLMMIESSFIPFPSEVVMIPAGYLVQQGKMHMGLVIFSGTAGSLAGALVNYYLAMGVGRAFLVRYARFFFLNEQKLEKVDRFFAKHGPFSTFTGRLVPMIRQLISIPAGLTRMKLLPFIIFTSLGAGIWMVILTLVGYFIGHNQELVVQYMHQILVLLLVGLVLLTIAYVLYYRKRMAQSRGQRAESRTQAK